MESTPICLPEECLILSIPLVALLTSSFLAFLFVSIRRKLSSDSGYPFHYSFNDYGSLIILSVFISLLYSYTISLNHNFHYIGKGNVRFILKLIPVSFVIICTGIIEKQFNLSKFLILLFQIFTAMLAWRFGVRIVEFMGLVLSPGSSLIITTIWLLFLFNILNASDGLGGLALIHCMAILLLFIVFIVFRRELVDMLLSEVLLFTCIGFYIFTKGSEGLSIGRTGTQFLGFYIGVISIFFFQKSLVVYALGSLLIAFFIIHGCHILMVLWHKSNPNKETDSILHSNLNKYINDGLNSSNILKKFKAFLFGVPIHLLDTESMEKLICMRLKENGKCSHILAVNPLKIYMIRKEPYLKTLFNNAFMLLPDGIGIVKAAYLLFNKKIKRVAGADLMESICKISAENGYSVFFYGSSEDVNKRAVRLLQKKHPGLNVAGRANGYIKNNSKLLAKINETKPDILFISIGSPAQEKWILENQNSLTTVKICQGVGGTLDTIAGNVRRATKEWQDSGLEWLFRILQEPKKRCMEIVLLLRFMLEVLLLAIISNKILNISSIRETYINEK